MGIKIYEAETENETKKRRENDKNNFFIINL